MTPATSKSQEVDTASLRFADESTCKMMKRNSHSPTGILILPTKIMSIMDWGTIIQPFPLVIIPSHCNIKQTGVYVVLKGVINTWGQVSCCFKSISLNVVV